MGNYYKGRYNKFNRTEKSETPKVLDSSVPRFKKVSDSLFSQFLSSKNVADLEKMFNFAGK